MTQERTWLSNEHKLFLFVILLSVSWMFLLTYNFSFFWEDGQILELFKNYESQKDQYSATQVMKTVVAMLFHPFKLSEFYKKTCGCCSFYAINYLCRPLSDIMDRVHTGLFGINLFHHRIAKAFLFSFLIFLYFYFLWRPFKESCGKSSGRTSVLQENVLFPVLILCYLLVLPEFFIAVLYYVDLLILTLFFSTASLFLFYFFYNKDCGMFKSSLLFFGIVLFAQMSILMKHVARINFILILFFLLITNRKKLLQPRYFLLVLALFFLSFPFLGLFDIFSGESIYAVVGMSGHLGHEVGTIEVLLSFIKTLHLSFIPHAEFLLLLLLATAAFHFLAVVKKNNCSSSVVDTTPVKNIVVWSGIWFLLEAFSSFISRGFVIEKMFFLRFEFSIFIFPQVLFVISYAYFVYRTYFSNRKWIYYVILLFLLLSIGHNILRLNDWRGGWGGYFLGYDTARQYVDAHEKQAVLLIKETHASPTYFLSNNTIAMIPELTNSSVLKSFMAQYSTVFIVHTESLDFNNKEIRNIANLTVNDESPYGMLKKIVGKYYKHKMYLYKVYNLSLD